MKRKLQPMHENRNRTSTSGRAAGVLLALLSVMTLSAQTLVPTAAATNQQATPVATSPAEVHNGSTPQAAHPSANSQSITVSGWWTIDIKNPDGKIVQHREFENAIYLNGTWLLSYLFTGKAVAGEPLLALTTSGTSPCGNGFVYSGSGNRGYFSSGCFLYSDPTGYWGGSGLYFGTDSFYSQNSYQICTSNQSACSTTLTVTLASQPNATINIQFAGNIRAAQSGTIDNVSTLLMVCSDVTPGVTVNSGITIPPSTTSATTSANPKSCYFPDQMGGAVQPTYGGTPILFTGTSITPISVGAGQTIQASVVISFASL